MENGAINAEDSDKEDLMNESYIDTLTHIISRNITFAGYQKALDSKVAVVTV